MLALKLKENTAKHSQFENLYKKVMGKDIFNKPLKIMVVEDEKEHNELISFILNKKGYEVVSFENALKALEYLKFETVDMIVSDLMMPKMDGLEFCAAVKAQTPNVYFILVTAKGETKDRVNGLNVGADEYIVKPFDIMEFTARIQAGERIVRSQKQLAFLNEQLEKVAETDSLTKIKNRRFFQSMIKKELNRAKRYGHTIALLMLDIDHFKDINDKYGHLVGDFILQNLAQTISESLRSSDIVCRYGGEEFVITLPETNPKLAFHTAEKVRRIIKEKVYEFEGHKISVTVSIGIVIKTPLQDIKINELIELADKALYKAKNEGRNKTIIYKWYNVNEINASP